LRGPQWLSGLEDAIQSLRTMPERCPVYRQFSRPAVAVRRHLFGRYPHIYKIYFTVESNTMWVLHVRHAARREPKREFLT
jgi:plasmid stabilization system protein ParE